MKIHITCLSVLFIVLALSGCDDMRKRIDVDLADFPPKIAVSAWLDTDMGTFSMRLYEGFSLVSYNRYQSHTQIIKNGSVQLYRDGQLVWSLAGRFDLSVYTMEYGEYGDIHRDITVTGLPVDAGSVYRLEIEMDGYQKAVATAVMPDPPEVSDATIDLDTYEKKNSVNLVTVGYLDGGSYFHPVTCTLSDNSSEQDYYTLQIFRRQSSTAPDDYPDTEVKTDIGVGNSAIIQDNPDVEVQGSFFDDTKTYDLYCFDVLLLSDLTFSGKSAELELFTTADLQNRVGQNQKITDYNPAIHGREVVINNQWEIKVGHITSEMFRHYRSLLLQEKGLGFFSEPVLIVSNVENGYGCFSLQNSRRIVLKEYKTYVYH